MADRVHPVRIGVVADPRVASFGPWRDVDVNLIWAGYIDGIHAAGAVPVAFPPTPLYAEHPELALDSIDGLLLNGGPDIQAASYGAEPHPESELGSELRDRVELAIAEAALATDLPILGICRGMQILNLAMGGGIDQHIDGADRDHRGDDFVSHEIVAAADSCLARVIGSGTHTVRSFHHQGLDPLASGFTVSATSPDGLAEAAEVEHHPFCLAVLWHPEQDLEGGGQKLFDALADSARDRIGAPA